MGQQDILNVLEKADRPLSRTEIAQRLNGISPENVSHSIARLVKSRSIKIMEIDRHQARKRFNCFQRMRLYYI